MSTDSPTTDTPSHHRSKRPWLVLSTLACFTVGAAACGGPAPIAAPAAPAPSAVTSSAEPATSVAPAAGGATSAVAVSKGETDLGSILVGDGGRSLYGFTNDLNGASVCTGTCAAAWPPVIVGADWNVAPGLDVGIFNTTTRDDGTLQLVAGKWPLYYYGGDVAAGEVNGQGNGEVWFVVGTDGVLIQDAASAANATATDAAAGGTVATAGSAAGEILVDEAGLSLYGFLDDADGAPTCVAACADAWPPVLVASPELPAGLDPDVFSVVPAEGGFQLKAGKWPLYRFAGDGAPGDINGQGSGDVWFLVHPDGSLARGDDAGSDESEGGY